MRRHAIATLADARVRQAFERVDRDRVFLVLDHADEAAIYAGGVGKRFLAQIPDLTQRAQALAEDFARVRYRPVCGFSALPPLFSILYTVLGDAPRLPRPPLYGVAPERLSRLGLPVTIGWRKGSGSSGRCCAAALVWASLGKPGMAGAPR